MRKILFRAKTVDNIWHYGFPIVYSDGSFDFYELEDNPIVETYNEIYKETKKGTLGQYTGIEDKNGTKMFEGDIVKGIITSQWAKQEIVCQVKYNKDSFVCIENDKWEHKLMFAKNIEVIGNIYDNPELIGGAK